jgi:hypothetical protein
MVMPSWNLILKVILVVHGHQQDDDDAEVGSVLSGTSAACL